MTAWLPTDNPDVTNDASPPANVDDPNDVTPSKNSTVPVGVTPAPDTVAVNVTPCPTTDGFNDDTNPVDDTNGTGPPDVGTWSEVVNTVMVSGANGPLVVLLAVTSTR